MRTKSNLFELCRVQPTFVKQNNDDLILAIQSAGVERGRNGFHKNKSTEKNPESEEDLLEHRTDGTDAFDTLYIGCEKFPQHDFYGGFVGGVSQIKVLYNRNFSYLCKYLMLYHRFICSCWRIKVNSSTCYIFC